MKKTHFFSQTEKRGGVFFRKISLKNSSLSYLKVCRPGWPGHPPSVGLYSCTEKRLRIFWSSSVWRENISSDFKKFSNLPNHSAVVAVYLKAFTAKFFLFFSITESKIFLKVLFKILPIILLFKFFYFLLDDEFGEHIWTLEVFDYIFVNFLNTILF